MNKPLQSTPSHRAARGFTLAEMMVSLTVLCTLSMLAVSGWTGLSHSMKLTSLTNDFLSQLHLARSEAIKRNTRVAMCKSADGATCVTGGGWEQGWILFQDTNNNTRREPAETLVYRFAAMPAGFRIAGNRNVANYVSFGSHGGTLLASGAFQAGTVIVCRDSSTDAREIVINSVGRPRVRKTTVGACA